MKKRKPAYMQLTRKCNNDCVFCSNPQFQKDYSLKEAKKQIKKFEKEEVTEIIFTGGEPTLCTFLLEIINFVKTQELDIKMITNGIKLSDFRFVKKLYKSGLRNINISIHSHDANKADRLSQKKGHWKKTIKGIENSLKAGINVNINTTINAVNCDELDKFTYFIIKKFPEINHFVFNGLDPGKSDGTLKSRAGKNPWIVPRFVDLEISLNKAVYILRKNNKSLRIERIPLCYMNGFEEFSTETRKIMKDEIYICSFIEKNRKNKVRKIIPKLLRTKINKCNYCMLDEICAGIQKEYLNIYGEQEIYPIFKNSKKIIKKII